MWGQAILYALVPLVMTATSSVLLMLGSVTVTHPDGYPDPFASYEAMMPGKWVVALEEAPCDFQTIPGQRLLMECDPLLATSPFVSIHAIVQDGRFVNVSFYARNLITADVIRHWGQPDAILQYEDRFFLRWDNGLHIIIDSVDSAGRFSYSLRVDRMQMYFERSVQ